MVACGMGGIDLSRYTVNILGVHLSCIKKVQMEKKVVTTVSKFHQVLKLWRSRDLTLEGKII